ncbi:MAG: lysylphosphatidylglycerol synthase transmembrane domain-containing protein [bacterium]
MLSKTARTNLVSSALGLALFAGLVYWVHATPVLEHLRRVGPWILPVILFYGIGQFFFILAWRVLLDEHGRAAGLWKISRAYLAGDAVNYVVVSGSLAGEPMKAHLLRDKVPFVEGLSSVTVNKLSESISMIAFQATGIVLAISYRLLSREMALGSVLVFVLMSTGILLFLWRQKKGLFAWMFRGLGRVGIARSFFEKMTLKAERLDDRISVFHANGGNRFRLSLLLNFCGWMIGAVEGFFLLVLLGVPATLPKVWAIEAITVLANNLFFFIPARLGGSDGGKVLVFLAMGMSSALGLSFGLLRRAREIVYVAIGFVFLVQMNPFRSRAQERREKSPAMSPTEEMLS